MNARISNLWKDDEGQDLIEYALIIVLVSVTLISALRSLVPGISDLLDQAGTIVAGS